MNIVERGRYRIRLAAGPLDMDQVLALRRSVFRAGRGEDGDAFDAACHHLMVEDQSCHLVGALRTQVFAGAGIAQSYASQFYDLTALAGFAGPMLELGRFALDPNLHDPDVLRLIWVALRQKVDAEGIRLLFGCSSFHGAEPEPHVDALTLLAARHLAPLCWRPEVKGQAFRFGTVLAGHPVAIDAGLAGMPPLLRSYLALGGWVSDHAVADPDLDTLHVFTAVEIARIPAARLRALRQL